MASHDQEKTPDSWPSSPPSLDALRQVVERYRQARADAKADAKARIGASVSVSGRAPKHRPASERRDGRGGDEMRRMTGPARP